jgi:Concanavalin A-like lectin/glucanases superfamily
MRAVLAWPRVAAALVVMAVVAALLVVVSAVAEQRALAGAHALADDATAGRVSEAEALVAARQLGKPIEVLSERGETREVYAQPDGSGFVATEHLRPVRTLKAGQWVGIDTTLTRASDGSIGPAASTVGLRFSSGGTGPMVSMTRAGRQLALSWASALPVPALDGDTAVYQVLPDVELRLRANVDGFSHVVVVKTAAAAADPRLAALTFGLSAPGLQVSADAQGSQQVVDAASGAEIFRALPPQMWDSTRPADLAAATGSAQMSTAGGSAGPGRSLAVAPGEGSRVARMRVSVAGGRMTLYPDRALLTGADTKYPVYIDPMWYTPKDSEWLMVSSGGWEKLHFSDNEGMGRCPIHVPPAGDYCGTSHVKRLFYRMPTSRFTGKKIMSAEFQVRETWSTSCTTRAVRIYRTKGFISSSTWSSTSDNWSDYLTTRDVANGNSSSCPADDVLFTVTSAVTNAARYGWTTTTFGLRAADEDDEYAWKRFADDAYLRVHYNTPPPQPKMSQLHSSPGGSCVDGTSPVWINRAPIIYADNLTDPDNSGAEGETLTAEFKVSYADASGVAHVWQPADTGTPVKKTAVSGSEKSSFSVQVPQSFLPVGRSVTWSVRAFDGTSYSPWSWGGSASSCYFKYDPNALPAPSITSNATDGYAELNPDDPNAAPQNGVGRYGKFMVTFDSRVSKYAYAVNTTPSSASARARASGTASEVISAMPLHGGVNTLFVTVWDAANNWSTAEYRFWAAEGTGPVARWQMDDAAGSTQLADTADKSGGQASYPATPHGTYTLGGAGLDGTALAVSGSTGYAATSGPVVNTSRAFTVSAWVRTSSLPSGNMTAVAQSGSFGSGFYLGYQGDQHRWVFKMQTADTDPYNWMILFSDDAHLPVANAWAHLVGQYDLSTQSARLYVNGQKVGEAAFNSLWNATGSLQIGRAQWRGSYVDYWTGGIDELQVFDRIVTADEVRRLYSFKPQATGLWRLNSGSGSPATSPDMSASATKHAVTLAGAANITIDPAKALVTPPAGTTAGALNLPGGNGDYAYTNAAVADTSGSFTVSAWVCTVGTPTRSMTVLGLGGNVNSAVVVRYDAAKGRYVLDVPSADASTATKATVEHSSFHQGGFGDWDHVAVSYDAFNSTITLYVNGAKEDSDEAPTMSVRHLTRTFSPIKSLQLGRALTGGVYPSGQNWMGQIDDVWVLNGALDDDQVDYLANPTEINGVPAAA